MRTSSERRQQHSTSYSSAADDLGRLRVAIWVHNAIAREARIRTEPRNERMTVMLPNWKVRAKVICAHAPIAEADAVVRRAFWTSLREEVSHTPRERQLFLLVDSNARLGSTGSAAFSDALRETENENVRDL